MKNITLLATADAGITRAEIDENGRATVETVAAGHDTTCLAANRHDTRIMFAGTRSGVLRSGDTGRSWHPCGLDGTIVKSIAVSPHDGNVVYAGLKPAGMAVTRDGGVTWRMLDGFQRIPNRWWWWSPAEPPDYRPYVMSIALSPTDPDVILAGVELGAVVRSADGGETWSRHRRGALRDCHSLKFHDHNGDWVYEAGGTGGGASFSRDGGRRFQKHSRGFARKYGIVCAADPERPEIWYACVAPSPFKAFGERPQSYLYRSSGGADWEPIGWAPHPLPATPTTLVTRPEDPGHLYAGLHNGEVWHSVDYGDTWAQLPVDLGGIWFSLLVVAGVPAATPAGAAAAGAQTGHAA